MGYINSICNGVIDMRLSSFGTTENDLPLIVENSFTGERMDNNPVKLNMDDILRILKSVL